MLRPPVPRTLGVLGACLLLPQYEYLTKCEHVPDSIFVGMCGSMPDRTLSLVFISPQMQAFMQTRKMVTEYRWQHADVEMSGISIQYQNKFMNCVVWLGICWWNGEEIVQETQGIPDFRYICSLEISCLCSVLIRYSLSHFHPVFLFWSWSCLNFQAIVMARAIMLTRTQVAYEILFDFLMVLMPDFNPTAIKCDFEDGQVNAWRSRFPNAKVQGCLWHYAVVSYLLQCC